MAHRSGGAYMWLSLAAAREPDAVGEREAAASQMTREGEADPSPMIRKALLEPLMADKPGLRFNRQRRGHARFLSTRRQSYRHQVRGAWFPCHGASYPCLRDPSCPSRDGRVPVSGVRALAIRTPVSAIHPGSRRVA
jgi:hypothetical protein